MIEIGMVRQDKQIIDYCIYTYAEDCEHSSELLQQVRAIFRGWA